MRTLNYASCKKKYPINMSITIGNCVWNVWLHRFIASFKWREEKNQFLVVILSLHKFKSINSKRSKKCTLPVCRKLLLVKVTIALRANFFFFWCNIYILIWMHWIMNIDSLLLKTFKSILIACGKRSHLRCIWINYQLARCTMCICVNDEFDNGVAISMRLHHISLSLNDRKYYDR